MAQKPTLRSLTTLVSGLTAQAGVDRSDTALHRANVWRAIRYVDGWRGAWIAWLVGAMWIEFGGLAAVWLYVAGLALAFEAATGYAGAKSLGIKSAIGVLFKRYPGLLTAYLGVGVWVAVGLFPPSTAGTWVGRSALIVAVGVWLALGPQRGLRHIVNAIAEDHGDKLNSRGAAADTPKAKDAGSV